MARFSKASKEVSISSQTADQIADWKAFVSSQKGVRFSRVDMEANDAGELEVRAAFGIDENNDEVVFSDTIRRLIEGEEADAAVHNIAQ
ncbi:MAG: hypothetical protein ACR2RF_33350 [Geminicoccaceae bacterium]